MASCTHVVEQWPRLCVDRTKSVVADVRERKFLDIRPFVDGRLAVAPQGPATAEEGARETTHRSRAIEAERMIPG